MIFRRFSWGLLAVAPLVGLIASQVSFGQESVVSTDVWPALPDKRVHLVTCFEPHPAFTPRLRVEIEQKLHRKVEALAGETTVESPSTEVAQWFARHTLDELTAAECARLGLDRDGKTLLLELRHRRGSYTASGVEYDGYFDVLGPLRRTDIIQRESVAEMAAALAVSCYVPTGRIQHLWGDSAIIRFPSTIGQGAPWPWRRLEVGSVLQLRRERLQPSVQRNEFILDPEPPRRDQFLVIEKVQGSTATAKLAVPDQKDDVSWFASLQSPDAQSSVRYLVRGVDTPSGELRLRVLIHGGREGLGDRPVDGYPVYVTTTLPNVKRPTNQLGVTNSRGEFQTIVSEGLQYVAILYGKNWYFRPFVTGCSPQPLHIYVPPQPPLMDFDEHLTRIEDRLRDLRPEFDAIQRRLVQAVSEANRPAAEQLADELRKKGNATSPLRIELEQLAREAEKAMIDIQPQIASLRGNLDKLDHEIAVQRPNVENAATNAEIQGLRTRINELWKEKLAWDELYRSLSRLVQLHPGDGTAGQRKAWLDKAYATKDPEVLAARQLAEAAAEYKTFEQLAGNWPALNRSVQLLIDRPDLWLTRVNRRLNVWINIYDEAREQLELDRKAAESGDTSFSKKMLEARVKSLAEIGNQLQEMVNSVEKALPPFLRTIPQ